MTTRMRAAHTPAAPMRAVAEKVKDLVASYGGVNSSEHGDGLARSEFNPEVFGPQLYEAMRSVKRLFDPQGVLNPGKIVHAPKMDDRSLFRFKPGYKVDDFATELDWYRWGWSGKPPRTREVPIYILWAE